MFLFKEFAGFQIFPNKKMALLAVAEDFLWLPLETQASWEPAQTACATQGWIAGSALFSLCQLCTEMPEQVTGGQGVSLQGAAAYSLSLVAAVFFGVVLLGFFLRNEHSAHTEIKKKKREPQCFLFPY